MKKLHIRSVFLLVLCALLCLSGCSEKVAVSAETFRTTMEGLGYTVEDATSQYNDPERIEQVYIALGENGAYQIEFYQFDSTDTAKVIFAGNRALFESSMGSSHSETSVSLANYEEYKLTTNGQYMVLSRVDNTMLYISVSEIYKDAVNTALEQLGY